MSGLLKTNIEDLFFEDSPVGRMKKEIWESSDKDIDKILQDYGIPTSPEWFKEGTYLQSTIRYKIPEQRK